MSVERRNIVVIGETGSGKSSFINMVVGKDVAETSDHAWGCTFESKSYDDDYGNRFYDTTGLNEPQKGTVSATDAMKGLALLLRNLNGGVNLIVFVIRKGRLTEVMKKNYAIFVEGICERKVPILLAVSGCEQDLNLNEWFKENENYFKENNMLFNEVVSGCFGYVREKVRPSMLQGVQQAYEETAQRARSILRSDRFHHKYSFGTWKNWLKKVLGSFWNPIAKSYGFPQISIYDTLKNALMGALGYGPAEATAVANEIGEVTQD